MCAVVSGAAKCWGQNGYGQLGDGTTTDSSTPVQVQGLERGVTSIAAFDDYSCAIVSGAAKCWGSYDHYRLGDGTTGNSSSTPVQMEGLERGVTSIAAGSVHTCAIVSGTVKCWGWNDDGQLGDGTTTDSTTPVQVRGLERGVTAIAVGTAYTCAVVSGAAKCWGLSSYGQIGDGTSVVRSSTPVQVKGLEGGVTEISSGHFHACAIVSGAAKCWGLNSFGQLGNGSKTGESSSTPVQVKGLESGVTSIGSFEDFGTCAIVSGAAKCWGGM
jgi:alpha-tubulin suppressor-like RCC1 family protein